MSYNNRHWHEHADDVDRYRKKDEVLDEEAESRTLKIEFDVLYQYYEDKVKITLSSSEFDGELTFETTTGNKARQAVDDLEQGEDEEVKPEPPKAVPPPSYRYESPKVQTPQTAQTNTQQQGNNRSSNQTAAQQTVNVHEQVQAKSDNANPLLGIASDIAEILRLGSELKPKIDKLRKK